MSFGACYLIYIKPHTDLIVVVRLRLDDGLGTLINLGGPLSLVRVMYLEKTISHLSYVIGKGEIGKGEFVLNDLSNSTTNPQIHT